MRRVRFSQHDGAMVADSDDVNPFSNRFDESDPHSLINMFPTYCAQSIKACVEKEPPLFVLDEYGLIKELRASSRRPSVTDNVLRMKFWTEYEAARGDHRKLKMNALVHGVCTKQFLYYHYFVTPHRVAWMLCPPLNYAIRLAETLNFATDQMRDILDQPHIDPDTGKVNVSLMNLKAKIFLMIDMRLNGAPTQRLEQKTLSISVDAKDAHSLQGMIQESGEGALERRLRELEQRERRALHVPQLSEWQTTPVTGKDAKVDDDKSE